MTSANMPRIEEAKRRLVSRTPRRSTRVEEAELFESWWAQIAADLKMEETFSAGDLSKIRRSLELWQSAVEATIREKVISEVVHKLSPDHSQQPSPFADDEEEENAEEPDEQWFHEKEMPEEAEEYLEEKKPSTGPPSWYDEGWCGPWEGGDETHEEETPDEAGEYVEDFSKSPEEAEEYLEAPEEAAEYQQKKPRREAPAWYDEGWCGPWEGGTTFTEQEEPEEAREYPELPNAEEWNTRLWEEPTNAPSSWQQQVDAAQQALAQFHAENTPVPMDASAGRSRVRRGAPARIRREGPLVDLRVCFHCGMEGHIRPRCPNRDKPRCRARAEESPPYQGAYIEEIEEESQEESLRTAWQRIQRARIAQNKKSRQNGHTVRFNAQKEHKEFKRGDPPILVRRSSPRLPNSEVGRSSLKGTVDVLCGHKAEERVMLRSDPAQAAKTQKQRKCLHEHWKNCHDYPEAHDWESRAEEDIKEEEAVRALVAAEDDSYLAYDEACKVRQFHHVAWSLPVESTISPHDLGSLTYQLLRSAQPASKQHKCLHEHWKNCHDYPEVHTWEARDQKDIEEEEAVRALVAAEDDSYLAYDEACRVRQLMSNLITRGTTPDAGRKVMELT
ncbi:hypothetical protein EI94DRAFT_1818300 [Lactarius quietus]|nr:hypothetical protein EI94DRAFT_1818300 [Lactarius quietus]